MRGRATRILLLPLGALVARSAWLGRRRPELLGGAVEAVGVAPPDEVVRAWITDGSLPVFSDTTQLETAHPALAGITTCYEGFVDPAVARGSLELSRELPGDALFVEAEWCAVFPDGPPADPSLDTPVVLQGLIEGKWMNRLLDTLAWQPASIGNNVLAAGPGIATTLGALGDGVAGEARIEYESERAGPRVLVARGSDLRGHNLPELVLEVLALGEQLDAIDLGALGSASAVVNEKARVLTASLPLPFAHQAKERLVWRALADGLALPPGDAAHLTVRDGGGATVGEGTLRLAG